MPSQDENPYASPRTESYVEPSSNDEFELAADVTLPARWGAYLVVPRDVVLPQRCVVCGVETDAERTLHRVFWFHPWLFVIAAITFFVAPFCLVGVIAASFLFFRKDGDVHCALCEKHAPDNRIWKRIAWFLAAMTFLVGVPGMWFVKGWEAAVVLMILAGAVAFMVAFVIVYRGSRFVRVQSIGGNTMWLKNLPGEFLAQYPELPSQDGRTPILPAGYD